MIPRAPNGPIEAAIQKLHQRLLAAEAEIKQLREQLQKQKEKK